MITISTGRLIDFVKSEARTTLRLLQQTGKISDMLEPQMLC